MLCEVCREKDADIVFKTVTGNQVATKAMCMGCANAMQQDMIKMFLALGFRKDQIDGGNEPAEAQKVMPRYLCAHCGRPFDHLDDSTMAGCPACYDAMRDELAGHFAGQGVEKVPEKPEVEQEAERRVNASAQELKYQLMEAVIREDFEEAAKLRDQIRQMGLAGEQA